MAYTKVVSNLLSNANKYTRDTIRLSCAQLDADTITIEVGDNGSGIPEEYRKRVFEPFFQVAGSKAGTGIGLSIVNALANKKVSYAELLFTNAALIGTAAALEYWFIGRAERVQKIRYDRIALIVPERRAELVADLRERTGLDVKRVEIGDVDFLRDTAEVTVFHRTRPAPRKEER